MRIHVNVQVATATKAIPSRASLARFARAALAGLRRKSVSVTLRVVGPKESQQLNSQFRRKDKPTNVLSFPFEAPRAVAGDLLGDIVICADVVRREARAQNKEERAHWAHMVVHGILHLRGFDHERIQDAGVMEAREIRILRGLGFPNPYTC